MANTVPTVMQFCSARHACLPSQSQRHIESGHSVAATQGQGASEALCHNTRETHTRASARKVTGSIEKTILK